MNRGGYERSGDSAFTGRPFLPKYPPECCVPLGPLPCPGHCLIHEQIVKTEEIVLHPGDIHCSFDLTAEDFVKRLLRGQISNLGEAIAQGLPLPVYQLIQADFDAIYAASKPLPDNVQRLLLGLIANVYDDGITGFAEQDVRNVRITDSRMPTASLYVAAAEAITLGRAVILKHPEQYDAIFSNDAKFVTVDDFISKTLDSNLVDAIDVMLHELVHVKQYRVSGQDAFLTNYLLQQINEAPNARQLRTRSVCVSGRSVLDIRR